MIKRIPAGQITIGMYIHDLNCGWMNHPFALNRFTVDKSATINRILRAGIKEVFIDTALGADVGGPESVAEEAQEAEKAEEPEQKTIAEALAGGDASIVEPSRFLPNFISRLSPIEEMERARELYASANKLMQDVMNDVRMGKPIALNQCEPMVGGIVDSMMRAPSVLLPLAQLKSRDEYTYQHSVAVSALAVAFGRVLELPHNEIHDIALGGLLHDVGKALIPGRILNNPGKLEEADFEVMKNHVIYTAKQLHELEGISEIVFNAAAEHHERIDGKGYPYGLKGGEISLHGQMIGIVDVYDAITSLRVYHKGIPPTEALRKLLELGGKHFDNSLVQAFIKGVGIYPAGSLVRMESGKLAIVREVLPDKLLQPVVEIIYDCKKMAHVAPEMVALADSSDKIKSHESYEKWGLDRVRLAHAMQGA